MSDFPKLGMTYSDVSKRCKRILKSDGIHYSKLRLVQSLRNQCRLHEGERATRELDNELSNYEKSVPAFSGAGNKQTGIGPGHKLGDGKWTYKDNKWEKVS